MSHSLRYTRREYRPQRASVKPHASVRTLRARASLVRFGLVIVLENQVVLMRQKKLRGTVIVAYQPWRIDTPCP